MEQEVFMDQYVHREKELVESVDAFKQQEMRKRDDDEEWTNVEYHDGASISKAMPYGWATMTKNKAVHINTFLKTTKSRLFEKHIEMKVFLVFLPAGCCFLL
jgi:hypothetical protein